MNLQCEISGEGLTSAQVGVWNHFVIATDHAGPAALHVMIQEANSEERVSPVVTRLTPTLLEVCYRPLVPGNYSIALQWGKVPIPGSPFQVKFYSAPQSLEPVGRSTSHIGTPNDSSTGGYFMTLKHITTFRSIQSCG